MFGPVPEEIKGVQHFMKLAEDHDARNILVSYYARMTALQVAMRIVPGAKPPEVSKYMLEIMDWLENTKRDRKDIEGISNDTVAQALIEDYTLKIYNVAYQSDCIGRFTKNVVKAYYTVGLLCEVLQQFGTLSEEMEEKGKIAKYRATYIHNMLKQGLSPQPINVTVVENDEEESEHILTEEEINERRKQRGEDPLPSNNGEFESFDSSFVEPPNNVEPASTPEQSNVEATIAPPFVPVPISTPTTPAPPPVQPSGSSPVANLGPDQIEKAQKYCKWASSALNYDDTKTAILNLEKALYLCKYGAEMP